MGESSPYEIVYGSKPRDKESEELPWVGLSDGAKPLTPAYVAQQYAMVVRRNETGGYTPLIKGPASSVSTSWSIVLQGLLDTTATLIHKTIGQARMPPLGILEALPQYSPPENSSQASRAATQ